MTDRDALPVLQDPEDVSLRKREILDSLQQQAVGGNVVAVAALERLERDDRYLSLIAGIDDDEDPATPIPD
ncbi:MAG: hypothetical protein HDS64_11960 [Bacteroidales bacterium]|nr:hypothetical protein [Bacteroidales bacterium]MBD5240459.1 hypothetical protein [Bacteroidales bacterium]